ncbi:MAG: hypothetical protein Q4A34_03905 [Candidatus Saccharibacteria bacterium]|nr:hypothetical protein [Candidatus Saccharibacteria bacterium]
MNIVQQMIASLMTLVSLATLCGVLMHDTNVDKAFVTALYKTDMQQAMADDGAAKVKPGSTPHTHPEHASLSGIMRESNARPRTLPRNTDRKYANAKRTRGNHEFDGNRLLFDPVMM